MTRAAIAVAVVIAIAHGARADDATVWVPQAVRWPVLPGAVEGVPPFTSAGRDVLGEVEVTRERAAALWLGPGEVVRVRTRGAAALRLSRVVGGAGARLAVDDPGVRVDGGVELIEPPGPGAAWVIAGDAPTAIAVERVEARAPRLAWEIARDRLRAWIDDGGDLPALPDDGDGAAAIRLRGARAAAASMRGAAAARAWRRAMLDDVLALARSGDDPYVAHDVRVPDGAATTDEDGAAFGPAPRGAWTMTLEGPGALVIDARAGAAELAAEPDAIGAIEVRRDGVAIARARDVASAVTARRDDGAAFPSAASAALGRRIRAAVTLARGEHRYQILVTGVGLVRADVRRRRPRLRDVLGLREDDGDGAMPAIADGDAAVSLYARLESAPGILPVEDARARIAEAAALPAARTARARELRDAIALGLLARLPDELDATPLARALLDAGRALPAPAILAALAPHLPAGPRSDAIAAAELAWRQRPDDAQVRRGLLAVWRASGARRLDPIPTSTPPVRLLTDTGDDERAEGGATVVDAPIGHEIDLEVAPHPTDPSRLAAVRVYVVAPPSQPVTVSIDGVAHAVVALAPAETMAFAAAPGRHRVRVDGPAGTHAYVAAPGSSRRRRAAIRTLWPVDRALVYALPSPRAAGPVRIELRAPARSGRRVVWLRPDAGAPRRLELDERGADPLSWPLDGDDPPGAAAAIELWLPPTTRTFTLATDDGPVLARVSVRAARDAEVAPRPIATGPRDLEMHGGLDEIAARSAQILAGPERAAPYLARAEALLELGESGAARRDLIAAAARLDDASPATDREAYARARDALEARIDPSYLPAQPPSGRIRDGELLSPPLDAGTIAARRAHRAGDARAAADAWLHLDGWQASAAALAELVTLPAAQPEAFGVAAGLDDLALPAIRRDRAIAARATRWSPIRDTEASAGFESLTTAPGPLDENAAAALRRALLAAPWPDAAIITAGNGTVIEVEGPREVSVAAWCRPLWPAAPSDRCAFTVSVDQARPIAVRAPHAHATGLASLSLAAGRHQIEVTLDDRDADAVAAIRFSDPQGAIAAMRPARTFVAAAERPAEIVVAGPGAIAIEVRGVSTPSATQRATAATRVEVSLDGAPPTAIAIDATPDPQTRGAPGRAIATTRPVAHTLLLIAPGPHRVRARPDRGAALVRFAARVASKPPETEPTPPPPPSIALEPEGLPWPALPPVPMLSATERDEPRWIPSAELVVGQDNLSQLDAEFAALDVRVEAAAIVHHRRGDVSLYGELRGRQSGPLGPTARVRLAGEVRRLPLGLSANLDLHLAAQHTSDATLWLARAITGVDRVVPLGARLDLVPELDFYAATFGPDHVPTGADPMVASVYRRDHPIQLAGHLGVRARPLADQLAIARVDARSNADLRTLDMVGATLEWRGLIEVAPHAGPIAMIGYKPTYRYQDDHRAAAFWRQDLAAELAIPWRLARGRLVLTLRGDLYPPSNKSAAAHAIQISLRWDDVAAGERDRLPSEEPLDDYVDEVPWSASP